MEKIPTLFVRDQNDRKHVTREIDPQAHWVIDGEGVATRKFDGSCCLVRGGAFLKRHEVKKGKPAPANFEPATDVDPNTGKQQGWVPVGDGPEDMFHREAWESWRHSAGVDPGVSFPPPDGTYELIGPKIQGNPEGSGVHVLINHDVATAFDSAIPEPPRDFDGLHEWMRTVAGPSNFEGIVWHHPDGRMVKVKRRDFA